MTPIVSASRPPTTLPPTSCGTPSSPALPSPTIALIDAVSDTMQALYALTAQEAKAQTENSRQGIELESARQHDALRQECAAIRERAKANGEGSRGFFASLGAMLGDLLTLHFQDLAQDAKAAWQSPNFWKDLGVAAKVIGTIATAIAGAAAAIASGGSALVLAGVAVSALGMADGEFHLLEKLGVNAKSARWLEVGFAVVGGGLAAAGALGLGGRLGSASAPVVDTLMTTAGATSGVASTVTAVAAVRTGLYESEAARAELEEKRAKDVSNECARETDALMDGLKEMSASSRRALEELTHAIRSRSEALTLVTQGARA